MEKITRKYNATLSSNVKRRKQINALRKDRTLYDHIFKTLEYQILNVEEKLFLILIKNRTKDASLSEAEKKHKNMEKLVSRNMYEDFYRVIENEKKKYIINLESLKKGVKTSKDIYKDRFEERKTINGMKIGKNRRSEQKKLEDIREKEDLEELNRQITFLEGLKTEFKFHSLDEGVDVIKEQLEHGEEKNETLYTDFCELEESLGELTTELERNKRKQNKKELDNFSVSTKVNTIQEKEDINITEATEEIEKEVEQNKKELSHLLVF